VNSNMTHGLLSRICTGIAALMLFGMSANAQPLIFQKIADAQTLVPEYPTYTYPGIFPSQGMNFESGALLWGSSFQQFPFDPDSFFGITAWNSGQLNLVADSFNPLFNIQFPNHLPMGSSDIDGDRFLFGTRNTLNNRTGIYISQNGVVTEIATSDSIMIPNISELFLDITPSRFVRDSIIFEGLRPDSQSGLYGVAADGSGEAFTIVDQSTPFPTFNDIGIVPSQFTPGEASGDRVSFRSQTETGITLGLYTTDVSGAVTTIAELDQPMPGGVGHYRDLGRGTILPSMDGNQVAFTSSDQDSDLDRIFIADAITGETTILLDNTQLPTDTEYPGLFMASISDGDVAFLAGFLNGSALLVNIDGVTTKILERGEFLDGKEINFIEMSPYSFDNGQVAFSAFFMDNTSALYVATVPAPGVTLIFGLSGVWAARRRRRAFDV